MYISFLTKSMFRILASLGVYDLFEQFLGAQGYGDKNKCFGNKWVYVLRIRSSSGLTIENFEEYYVYI